MFLKVTLISLRIERIPDPKIPVTIALHRPQARLLTSPGGREPCSLGSRAERRYLRSRRCPKVRLHAFWPWSSRRGSASGGSPPGEEDAVQVEEDSTFITEEPSGDDEPPFEGWRGNKVERILASLLVFVLGVSFAIFAFRSLYVTFGFIFTMARYILVGVVYILFALWFI